MYNHRPVPPGDAGITQCVFTTMAHLLAAICAAAIGLFAGGFFLGPLKTDSTAVAAVAALVSMGLALYMPCHAFRGQQTGRIYMRGWVERRPTPLKFRMAIVVCYLWCALCFAMLASSAARLLG